MFFGSSASKHVSVLHTAIGDSYYEIEVTDEHEHLIYRAIDSTSSFRSKRESSLLATYWSEST